MPMMSMMLSFPLTSMGPDFDLTLFCVVKSNSLLSGLRSEVKIIGVHSEYSVDQGHSCTKPNVEMSRLIKYCIQQWFVKSYIDVINQVTYSGGPML